MIPLVLVIGFVFYRIAFKPKSAFSFIAMLVFLYGSVFLLYGSFVDLQTEQFMAYNSASGPFILIIAALANAIASFLAYVCADASESKVLTSGTWWALFGVFASLAIAGAYELEGLMIGLAAVSFVFALIFSLASRSSSIDHRPRMNHSSLSDAERDAIRRQLFYGSPTGGPSYRDYMDDSGSQYGTGSETSSSSFLSKEGGNTSTIVSPAGYVRDIYGNQTGRVEGGVIRDVYGNQIGRIEGRIIRDAHGNHTGTFENGKLRDIYGNYLGELRGNCFYDADGNHQGSVE